MTLALILTTLPHCIAAWHAQSPVYKGLLYTSTALSVSWHAHDTRVLATADHLFACIVFLYEVLVAFDSTQTRLIASVLITNLVVVLGNRVVVYLDMSHIVSYETGHSVWHLLSAAKSFYLADALSKVPRNGIE